MTIYMTLIMDHQTALQNNLATLGWSQAKLAKLLGLSPNTVSRWAKSTPTPFYAVAYTNLAIKAKKAAEGL